MRLGFPSIDLGSKRRRRGSVSATWKRPTYLPKPQATVFDKWSRDSKRVKVGDKLRTTPVLTLERSSAKRIDRTTPCSTAAVRKLVRMGTAMIGARMSGLVRTETATTRATICRLAMIETVTAKFVMTAIVMTRVMMNRFGMSGIATIEVILI